MIKYINKIRNNLIICKKKKIKFFFNPKIIVFLYHALIKTIQILK